MAAFSKHASANHWIAFCAISALCVGVTYVAVTSLSAEDEKKGHPSHSHDPRSLPVSHKSHARGRRFSDSDLSGSESDFFLCSKDLIKDIIPVLIEKMPDPTSVEFVPERIREMEYAVRGQIPIMAMEIEKQMKSGKKFPFDQLVYCNIGNPIAVGHQPFTYMRQLISSYWSRSLEGLPSDVSCMLTKWDALGSSGAYSNSRGHPGFRRAVHDFLNRRDAMDRPECDTGAKKTVVYLSDGASGSVVVLLEYLIDSAAREKPVDFAEESELVNSFEGLQRNIQSLQQEKMTKYHNSYAGGIFIPVPQYPLYSATIRRLGGTVIPYELDEDRDWSLPPISEFENKYAEAVANGLFPKAFVLINPGNPSGNVFSREDLKNILNFCARRRLVLIADEVYQENVWGDKPFIPMRQIAFDDEEGSGCKLASFHSCSKGLYGECGVRGGFMALDNFPDEAIAVLDKCFSVKLCPNLTGQVAIAGVCTPPEGESKELYLKERAAFFKEMKHKAKLIVDTLNELEMVTCRPCDGAMYAFPRITLSERARKQAAIEAMQPDAFYCKEMMYNTGIVTVPGSGFKQKEGTAHFRITLLPKREILEASLALLTTFHKDFVNRYRD